MHFRNKLNAHPGGGTSDDRSPNSSSNGYALVGTLTRQALSFIALVVGSKTPTVTFASNKPLSFDVLISF